MVAVKYEPGCNVADSSVSFRQLPARVLKMASDLDSLPGTPGLCWDRNGRGDRYAKLVFYLPATHRQYSVYLGKTDDATFQFLKVLVDKRREIGRRN